MTCLSRVIESVPRAQPDLCLYALPKPVIGGISKRVGGSKHDAEDDAKDAFVRLLRDWVSFVHDSILPAARFRWVALDLFRARHRIRELRRRTEQREVVPDEVPITVIDTAPPADQALSARSSCLFFGAPRPQSGGVLGWRTWSMAFPCGSSPGAAARCDDLQSAPVRQARFQGRSSAGRAFRAVSDGAATAHQVGWAGDL